MLFATVTVGQDGQLIPDRGITMDKVEQVVGAPQEKMTPVGDPPITRWVYRGMTVYFEYERVLHTVVAP